MMNSFRRLILFARAPVEGRVKTRLIPVLKAHGATALYRRLLFQTFRTARAFCEANFKSVSTDPYEKAIEDGGGYWTWYAQQMWLLVPIQGKIKEFFADFEQYPYQTGSSLNASGIGYGMLQKEAAIKRLKDMESLKPR